MDLGGKGFLVLLDFLFLQLFGLSLGILFLKLLSMLELVVFNKSTGFHLLFGCSLHLGVVEKPLG